MTEDRRLAIRLAQLLVENYPGCTCEHGALCMQCHAKQVLGADMPTKPICGWCKSRPATHEDQDEPNGMPVGSGRCCGHDDCCIAQPGVGYHRMPY